MRPLFRHPHPMSRCSMGAWSTFLRRRGASGATRAFVSVMALMALALLPGTAAAFPDAPAEFCRVYPDSPGCAGAQVACGTCHELTPPERNVFGAQVEAELAPGEPRPLSTERFLLALPEALGAVELLDADDDGFSNLEEIIAGSLPADATSIPTYDSCTPEQEKLASDAAWDVCHYDEDHVFKRVWLDFCGRSPSWDELGAFRALPPTERLPHLHELLDTCLASDHWKGPNGVVWNLANDKITPSASLKSGDTFLGEKGDIPLADYTDDYLLFVYVNTGARDVRDLLVADYFVALEEDGSWRTWDDSTNEQIPVKGFPLTQLVAKERRVGMITARWFLMANTMFTAIPRTTAAQAYRAYLGFDIAKMQGLYSIPDEPVDYDAKTVQRPECAACHATLDPLTYPFTRYEGIGGGGDGGAAAIIASGAFPFSYNADRLERFTTTDGPEVLNAPEAGMIFGQPVADLREWASVAANSDAFAQNIVHEYWELLVGEAPRPGDSAAFEQLWNDLMSVHGYRVEAMLHALIETEAYGVP